MAKVGVIGGGAFGTAMACVLARSGHEPLVWAREPEVVAWINGDGINPLFLSGVRLVPGILATNDLAAATREKAFLVIAVPAQHLRGVAAAMQPFIPAGTPVVTCSKGIERGSCALMPEVLAETLPGAGIAVLSGPSFAREIAADLPCGVTLACADARVRAALARGIANPRFCVHPSDDVIGARDRRRDEERDRHRERHRRGPQARRECARHADHARARTRRCGSGSPRARRPRPSWACPASAT